MSTKNSVAQERIPVLLLKTKSTPNDGYEEQFSAVKDADSFEPTFVPVLEHKFLEEGLSIVRDLLKNKEIQQRSGSQYGGLIFTSQRAVEAFAKLVEEGKGDAQWPHLQNIPIYSVGPATSRALRSIPQSPAVEIFGSETGNGEALAHYMLEHYKSWYPNHETLPPLLFLVGEQRRDIIPKTLMNPALPKDQRIQVDELVVYGTGVMESFEHDFSRLLKSTSKKAMSWVVVFSPTGCEAMLRALGMLDPDSGKFCERKEQGENKTFVATIGPTTRDYLKNTFGYDPDVCAAKPSPEGVEEEIRAFMDRRNIQRIDRSFVITRH